MRNPSHPHWTPNDPYEDAVAAERRWGRLDPQDLERGWRADPLHFIADHVCVSDRREGAVALFMDFGVGAEPLLAVIPDAPANPTDDDCIRLLSGFVAEVEDRQAAQASSTLRMGFVHHRPGPASVTPLDQQWMTWVEAVARAYEFEIVGVMARTEAGALVPIPAGRAA
jgi:hypothetical protein